MTDPYCCYVITLQQYNHAKYDIPAGISAAGNKESGAKSALSGRKFGLWKVEARMRAFTSNSSSALGGCAGMWGPDSSTCAPDFSEFLLRAASGNCEAEIALHTHVQSTRKTTIPEIQVKPLLPAKFSEHMEAARRNPESGNSLAGCDREPVRALARPISAARTPSRPTSLGRRAVDGSRAARPRRRRAAGRSPAVIAIASDGDRRVSHGPRLRCGEDISSPNECVGFGLDQVKFQIPDSGMPPHMLWFRVGPTT